MRFTNDGPAKARALSEAISQADEEALETALVKATGSIPLWDEWNPGGFDPQQFLRI